MVKKKAKKKVDPQVKDRLEEKSSQEMSLVEIERHKTHILETIMESGGELTPELEGLLANVEMKEMVKVDGYGHVIDRLTEESKYWKDQGKKLTAVGNSCAKFVGRLKDRIKFVMQESNQTEVCGSQVRFKLSDCAEKLVIENEDAIPGTYLMEVVTHVPDKERIKNVLVEGGEVPGCRLEGGSSLRKYINRGGKK